jgi:adenylyltransferase/sulfurtransferase
VLVVGVGGLGCSVAVQLAAAGVGRIGLVDGDVVELSNLQRQILYTTADIGVAKSRAAASRLKALNPDLTLEECPERLSGANALNLVRRYDIVVDCSDNLATRFLLNEVCVGLLKPWVYAAVLAFTGQIMTVIPGRGPCYRCLYREEPATSPPGTETWGVLPTVPGVVGYLQANEVLKYFLGVGELLVGRMLIFEALTGRFEEVEVARDPACPDCGG